MKYDMPDLQLKTSFKKMTNVDFANAAPKCAEKVDFRAPSLLVAEPASHERSGRSTPWSLGMGMVIQPLMTGILISWVALGKPLLIIGLMTFPSPTIWKCHGSLDRPDRTHQD